ncbi:MAG: Sir2 family NAD-dependent protein deacetylase [Alphaproteobacteria bacterium]
MTLAGLIREAENVVVFTGAGISTESGIPDFRSPGGIWTKMAPIYFDEYVSSEAARREAWRRRFEDLAHLSSSKPNAGHYAIATLVKAGKVSAVVTQNIDNLHQDSGVPPEKVIEVHGNATYAKCLDCGVRIELAVIRAQYDRVGTAEPCAVCGGLVKSATISFGQPMPDAEMERAQDAALACDLMFAIGSSLVVYPAAAIPLLARKNGARLVILNREPTELDPHASLVINGEIGPVMMALIEDLSLSPV